MALADGELEKCLKPKHKFMKLNPDLIEIVVHVYVLKRLLKDIPNEILIEPMFTLLVIKKQPFEVCIDRKKYFKFRLIITQIFKF